MAEEDTGTAQTDEAATDDEAQSAEPDVATLKAELDKWKSLSRKHEGRAKANEAAAKRVAELEDASKSEIERLTDKAKTDAQRADEAEARATRYEVALDKKVPANLMKFLTGNTREDMEQSADELLEALSTNAPDTGADADGARSGKPKERLRPGAAASDEEPETTDPRKLAALIPRSGQG